MSARTHRPLRPSQNSAERLPALAIEIDEAFSDLVADEPAHLLRVVERAGSSGTVELGLLPLEPGQHPIEVMAGFLAPPEWQAVGVVTAGRSHQIEDGKPRLASEGERRPIRLTFLLDRGGHSISLVTPLGVTSEARRALHEPPDGALADACRRVLGLPTAPPTDGPEVWLTVRWLDQLLAVAVAEPGAVCTWRAAAKLHPLVGSDDPPTPAALARLVDDAVGAFDWERLRRLAARGTGAEPGLEPAVAAWMDAGYFARHLLGAELPIELMLGELEALVSPAVHRAVQRALPRCCGGPA